MESTVTPAGKSTVRLDIKLTAAEMQRYFDRAAHRLAEQVRIDGFRKGKVPRSVLEQRFGAGYLADQAAELALTDSYYQAVMKHKLQTIGRPDVQLPEDRSHLEQGGFAYTATAAVVPKVSLGDYRSIKTKPVKSAYREAVVKETLAKLQEGRAEASEVKRPARVGDRVEIDFIGRRRGQPVPGAQSENHPLVIGEDNFVPGFSEKLVGLTAGKRTTFKLKFPKDYRESSLAGANVEFEVTMKRVQVMKVPLLDDAFAKQFGAKTLDDLRKRLAENHRQEADDEARRATQQVALEALLKKASVELPDALVEEELNRMFAEFREQLDRQGIPYEKYLEHLGKSEDELRKEQRTEAERRVKLSLVVNTLAEVEKIVPTEAQVTSELKRQQELAGEGADPASLKSEEFRNYVVRVLTNRLAVEWLTKHATRS
jgi:trigger factor